MQLGTPSLPEHNAMSACLDSWTAPGHMHPQLTTPSWLWVCLLPRLSSPLSRLTTFFATFVIATTCFGCLNAAHSLPTHCRATWMVGSVAAGAGAAVLASLVSMYTPPPSIWVPIAAIALAIGVFGGLAHWILSHVKGAAAGSSQGSVSASQALDFIKQRRSVYPKDMTGKWLPKWYVECRD